MNNLKTKRYSGNAGGEKDMYEELSKRLGIPVVVRQQSGGIRIVDPEPVPKLNKDSERNEMQENCGKIVNSLMTYPADLKALFMKSLVTGLEKASSGDLKTLASEILGTKAGTEMAGNAVSDLKNLLNKTENRAVRAENNASSLERKLRESESLRQGYVRRIAELEKNLAAAKDENARLSEELVVAARNNAPAPEKDESALLDEYLKLEQENAELKAQVAAKDAMLSGITSGSDGCSCGLNVPERELAPGELKALLVTLASERLSRMSDSSRRTTEHRRLLDLLSAIVSNNPVPESYLEFCRSVHGLKGSSKQTAYVREMLRIGFEEQNNPGTHRKFYFRGDERYCTMQGVSPSDVKAMDSSTHQIELMLLIPGAESVSHQGENMI